MGTGGQVDGDEAASSLCYAGSRAWPIIDCLEFIDRQSRGAVGLQLELNQRGLCWRSFGALDTCSLQGGSCRLPTCTLRYMLH